MAEWALVLSCEHGGNRIPPSFTSQFIGQKTLLNSHRGWDPGALALTRDLEAAFKVHAVTAEISRLVVDLNRSVHHPRLVSPLLSELTPPDRAALREAWYWPYRREVEERIDAELARVGKVLHLSVHSFTPVLEGQPRLADIGLLYDPKRKLEKEFCRHWGSMLRECDATLRVRMNYPYRGASDGFTTALRRKYPPQTYLGIELEVNQAFPLGPKDRWKKLRKTVVQSLEGALARQGF